MVCGGNFGKFGENISLQGRDKNRHTIWVLSVNHPIDPPWASVTLEEIREEAVPVHPNTLQDLTSITKPTPLRPLHESIRKDY